MLLYVILKKGFSSYSDFTSFSLISDFSLNINSGRKLVHKIKVTKKVIDMLELWLNKAKEVEVVRDHISVFKLSGVTSYKKILFKSLNLEKIRKVQAIVKNLMNLDASGYESDKNYENYEDL